MKPHTRAYKEKKNRTGFTDKSLEKRIQRDQYLYQAQKQKEIVMQYIQDNKITFSEIQDTVSVDTRTVFLQWIALANMSTQKIGRTEYGQEYKLIRNKGTCILKCEDGDLTMPAYELEFNIK